MKPRIGIYPGTFDPIHQGHISFAQETARAFQLDEVVFLPEPRPRGKRDVTNIAHRIAITRRVLEPIAGFRMIHVDSEQFTVKETLPELHASLGDASLTFLIGSDVVRTFPYRWEGLDTLFATVSFAIGMRADDNGDEIDMIMATMAETYGTDAHYGCVRAPNADLASSQIRNGLVDARLHPDALDYIQKHGLYDRVSV